MTSIPTYTIDSFTTQPFKGNPAAVCLLENPLSKEVMLSIAQELNLSETAFVMRLEDHFSIQYFSPIQEIPLCGHATLAAAKIFFEERGLDRACFVTNSDVLLKVQKVKEQIEMEFPSYSTSPSNASSKLLKALNINTLIDARFNKENNILMLVIEEQELEKIAPDFNTLLHSQDDINGVLVTSSCDRMYDFKSRYFWPWSGGNEDPVTGATHTFMAPYWAEQLNKKTLKSFQASKRTGFMDIEMRGNDRVAIRGNAVILMKGTLTI